jgi:hypothetical protein
MVEAPEHDVRRDELRWAVALTRYPEMPLCETGGRVAAQPRIAVERVAREIGAF